MTRLAGVIGMVLVSAATAAASPDDILGLSGTSPSIGPASALAPISIVEGPGIKVGEGTVLHPIIGLETAFISNAFYEETDPKAAAVSRVVARFAMGSLSPQRLLNADGTDNENLGRMQYRAAAQLSYEYYMSGDETLQEQGGLGVAAMLRGVVLPNQPWSFLYLDTFERVLRATNFESTQRTNRDINRLYLGLRYAPKGRSIDGLLQYINVIDFFEDEDQRFANRLQHTAQLTVNWRVRPITNIYGEVSQGFYGGLGSTSTKVDSYPLTVSSGIQTLLSLRTSVIARIGYTNGFYSSGPNFSAVLGGLQVGYRYAPHGRIAATYEYGHHDSINANFYRDHVVHLDLEQRFPPFVLLIRPEVRFRNYQGVDAVVPGPATRGDTIFAATVSGRYNFRDSVAAILEYRFSSVQTDYMTAFGDDPSFARHEVVAGVRAAL